ncbi:hypothetical protein JVU11DRAFT_9630 [Chiua virens]|nr:hypothetical protein JVU11DRAFT_9630 [Chiua virens]
MISSRPRTLIETTSDATETVMLCVSQTLHRRYHVYLRSSVAIDRYKSPELDYLTGCKNDGKRFINVLTGVLGVPDSHIMFLADEQATQKSILKQFDQFLLNNENIQQDDAIVFFFAGHGTFLEAPQGWVTESGMIEILCPHDVQTVGVDGEQIWGISDRRINTFMRELAFKKGDNIVAVFDCCHSGGLSRAQEGRFRVRSIPPPPRPPPPNFDQEIWLSIPEPSSRSAKTVIQTGFQYKAMESHVFLAACRPDEQALEDKDGPGGLFTTALIQGLCNCSLHDTTYVKLFEALDVNERDQHPQCEGTNKDRLLFSVNTIRDGETTFKVYEKRNKLYVTAGKIHGVVVGTEFSVLTLSQPSSKEAIVHVSNGKATVSQWNHFSLRVHSSIRFSSPHFTVVPSEERGDVALNQIEFEKWEIERLDTLIPEYSTRVVRFDADAKRTRDILDAISNFNSYLYRSDGGDTPFSEKVKTRLNRLGTVNGGEFGPVDDDLLEVPLSSSSGIEVKQAIITDLDARYCLTLENYSETNLFPYIFYFDPSDYGVFSWYIPPSSTMPPPLKPIKGDGTPSVFACGYGAFGTNPIEFYLPPGNKTDSGFLKIFLTTDIRRHGKR